MRASEQRRAVENLTAGGHEADAMQHQMLQLLSRSTDNGGVVIVDVCSLFVYQCARANAKFRDGKISQEHVPSARLCFFVRSTSAEYLVCPSVHHVPSPWCTCTP